MFRSVVLWLHDTVNWIWSSWLTSPTHRAFFSTGCSLSLKTWSGTKSIVYSRAFHHLIEFLHLISSLWNSLCVVPTHSMPLFGILKFFCHEKSFQGMRSQVALCWVTSSLQSLLPVLLWLFLNSQQHFATWVLLTSSLQTAKCSFIRHWSESFVRRLNQSGFSIHTGQADSLPPLWCQI